ncbi:lysophospholipid acyltransferase family protein [Pseudacidovorax intermedius]|uniref:lysophospholipid acyltransferase family protein n=1 Tax=Pseudacidovorax intermedius TaxID=433924 RepID=UPI0009E940C7|nr:lysophospholipid acyltransferase family protein [Pseudacidovorax intermedius]
MNDLLDADTPPPRVLLRRAAAFVSARLIVGGARLLTGVRAIWSGTTPLAETTLYFANHSSHGDFVLVWATLPPDLRACTRPVAGQDYWLASRARRFIGRDVFNALMIRRDGSGATGAPSANPVEQMVQALQAGDSLIMFPEGTRNTGDAVMLPLKSGLFHLARACPQVRLVPVWIENLRRVLPKGQLVPVPLACSVRYGAPVVLAEGEDKASFLARAQQAMLDLRPDHDKAEDASTAPPAAAPIPSPPAASQSGQPKQVDAP